MVIEVTPQEAEEKLKELTGNTFRVTNGSPDNAWVKKKQIKEKYGIPDKAFSLAILLKKPFIRKDDWSLPNSPIRVREREFVNWYTKEGKLV